MSEAERVAAVLDAAANLVDTHWEDKAHAGSGLVTAITLTLGWRHDNGHPEDDVFLAAVLALQDVLGISPGVIPYASNVAALEAWNGAPGRTEAEVVAALRTARRCVPVPSA